MPGLIETVRVHSGRAPLWPLHLARLTRSATELGVPLPSVSPPSGPGDFIVRYTLHDGVAYVAGRAVDPVSAIDLVSTSVVHEGYPHKTDQRNWLDDARVLAQRGGGDDALLCQHEGWVVEASIWAVGWWEEAGLVFPPLTLGGLPSVARKRLGELVSVREERVRREALVGRSLVACNAARGVVVVRSLDGQPLPEEPRTVAVQEAFWDRPA